MSGVGGGGGEWAAGREGCIELISNRGIFFLSHGDSCEDCSKGEMGPALWFAMTPPAAESVGAEERA